MIKSAARYKLLHQEGIEYLSRVDPVLAAVIGEIEFTMKDLQKT